MNNAWEWGHDWRRSRVPGLHLIEIAWERRPGEWFALHVALLGVWGTWTLYRKRYVVSGFDRGIGAHLPESVFLAKSAFQFHEDPWPEGVPRENQGRGHA